MTTASISTSSLNPHFIKHIGKDKPEKNDKKEESIPYYRLFRYATTKDKLCISFASLCAIICGGLNPYMMLIFGDVTGAIVDYAAKYNDSLTNVQKTELSDTLYVAVTEFAIYSCISGVILIVATYISGILFSYSALRQMFQIRRLFFEKTLNKDITWYDLNKTGDFATTFTDNITKIEEGISEKLGIFIYFMTIFVTGILTALVLGWKLALVCLISLPVSTILMGLVSWLSTKFAKQELQAYSAAGSIAEEVLSSVRTVVAFDGQTKEFQRYEKHLTFAKNNNIRKSFFASTSNGLMWFFVFASYALSFWYGVTLILQERDLPDDERVYNPAKMVTVFFCTLTATWNFGSAAPYFEIFGVSCGAASKVFKVVDEPPEINLNRDKGNSLDDLKGELLFENIYFHYPSRTDVKILQGFTLKVNAGETVALVGSSGCGKSTCIQLIQRFYDPNSGNVLVDDVNIKTLNLTWLRSRIGVVGQEPVLFATTIAENIKYGNLAATQADVVVAAKKANVHNFIKTLPHGYETVIGERGAQLSGGQKQRIAIARALIRQPKILLLDEATSALDTTSEAEVQAALDAVSGECTTIIVAHRLSTIRNADRIVVVSEGRVIEEGAHNSLMNAKGAYYSLVVSQGLDEPDIDQVDSKPQLLNRMASIEEAVEEKSSELLVTETGKKPSQSTILSILRMNRPEGIYIVMGCLTAIVNGAALPVYGVVFGDIMGVLASPDKQYVRTESDKFSLYFVIIGIISGLATFIQMHSFNIAGERLTLRIRGMMFKTMLHQEMGWFDRRENGIGALCAKLSSEAASVQGAGGIRIGTILNSISTFIIANTIALYFEWKLSLTLLSFSPIILLSVYFEQKFTQGDTQSNQKYLEKSAKIAVEAIGNIKTVASLGCEQIFFDKYVIELQPYIKNVKKQMHFRAFVLGVARSVMFFAYAVGMGYGAHLIIEENMDYAIVMKVSEIVIVGSWSIGNAFSFSPNFEKGLQAAKRIFELLNRVPEVKNVKYPSYLEKVRGELDYSQVHFAYPTRPSVPILNGLDLTVLEGKTVALVGKSGCGKSTIIQLLERFYDPKSGSVSLDGEDTKTIDIQNLRSHLGIVSQEPNLFDCTIAENIAYGANHRHVEEEEIIEAAKSANIHNFITSLPLGYETGLGSKGAQLSGGQKQRIAIARALVRNPRILLLDEATSALDNESEKIVQEALDNARKNRTCITIAHRLTTIQDADVICVLDEGVVVEMGQHAELLRKKGHYYRFYKLQSGRK